MGYYDDEESYRSSARFYGFVFKVAFNFAIIMILYKLLYFPNYPEELKSSEAHYIMPLIGIIGAYFYLSYWFGRKSSLYIVGIGSLSIILIILTSVQTLFTLYGLALLIGLGYGGYLLIKVIIQAIIKRP